MLSAASGRPQLGLHSGVAVHRPGRLERFIRWHLNQGPDRDRLRRMLAYGLITRTEYS